MLKYALEHGMINMPYISEQIEMNKRKELLEKHPYTIWEGKDGKWYTYINDGNGIRKLKVRTNKCDLEEFLVCHYKEKTENPMVKEVFQEWLDGKVQRGDIEPATRDRYENQFKKCFSTIADKKIKGISEYDIEEFVLNCICENNLTVKSYSNMRTLLYGTFRMAKKKKYIDYSISNIVKDIEISRKAFRKTVKEDDEEVFTEEELPIILKYLEDNQDIINLGILLVFKTGMRIGELVSLEPKDFCEDRIHIYKTEVKYKTEKGQMKYEVREFPKTEAGIRDIYIPKSCLWILKKIRSKNPFGEYVFERNGKRLRAYVFNNRLRTICKRLNIKPKSPHKIRKTYGTILLDSGVEESFIISQMGHTSIKTTKKHYYRNRKNSDGKSETINSIVGL